MFYQRFGSIGALLEGIWWDCWKNSWLLWAIITTMSSSPYIVKKYSLCVNSFARDLLLVIYIPYRVIMQNNNNNNNLTSLTANLAKTRLTIAGIFCNTWVFPYLYYSIQIQNGAALLGGLGNSWNDTVRVWLFSGPNRQPRKLQPPPFAFALVIVMWSQSTLLPEAIVS